MRQPLITCVIATHNYGRFVGRAIRSVLGQEGLPAGCLEVLVVDDGSTDDTPAVLSSFGDAITTLRQENAGPAVATNRAIRAARGHYIALLDADDEWLPAKLSRQLELFERRPEVALVHGNMELIDDEGNVIHPSLIEKISRLQASGRVLGRLLEGNQVQTTLMMRTDAANSLPPAPSWVGCRDWWIAAHVAAKHEIDAIHEPIARYRMHGANLSQNDRPGTEPWLRLEERDIRVQRLMMRTLDLGLATLDELAAARLRHVDRVRNIAMLRGIALTEVVPVDDADRAAAAAARELAREALASAPLAAGQHAARAMAIDPFDGVGQELFELARMRTTVPETLSGPLSASQADRFRELDDLRDAVLDAVPSVGRSVRHPADLLALLRRLELVRASVLAGMPLGLKLPEPTAAHHEQAFAALRGAVDAAGAGDHLTVLARSAAAVALDPADENARELLQTSIEALGGPRRPATNRGESQRLRLGAPAGLALPDARAFVATAEALELIEQPGLLHAWAEAFAPTDQATLAITFDAEDVMTVHAQLAKALADAGLNPDGDYDFALIHAPDGSTTQLALAGQAHAVLSGRALDQRCACLGGHPAFGPDDPRSLRALATRRWSADSVGAPLAFALNLCPERWNGTARWVDTHLARGLAAELRRRGHAVRIEVEGEQYVVGGREDVLVHLRGNSRYVPRDGQLNVLWSISHPSLLRPAECDAFDLVAASSARHAESLAARTSTPVIVLEHATDPSVFFPQSDPAHARDLVLVGNAGPTSRPIVRDLIPTEVDLAIWGCGWAGRAPARYLAGEYLPYENIRRVYGSAGVVLSDHDEDMRAHGIVSCRVYDALACGSVVVSDHLREIEERFGGAVATYRNPGDLRATIARLLADPSERAERASRGQALVRAAHTFRHRVDVLLDAIVEQLQRGLLGIAA